MAKLSVDKYFEELLAAIEQENQAALAGAFGEIEQEDPELLAAIEQENQAALARAAQVGGRNARQK